jgi:hypothetical protein
VVTKLTSKEEAYARARADGKGPSDAYRASRDTSRMSTATISSNAKRLERKPAIQARIEELRRRESGQESSDSAPGTFGEANRLSHQPNRGGQGGEGDPADQGPRIGHLDSLGGVVREMSAVYREVRTGKTEPDIGCKLVYILREIRAALEAHVLERLELRLQAIEGGHHGNTDNNRALTRPH